MTSTAPRSQEGQREVPRWGPLRFARMTGSSIAGRDAAPWVTDFLNAAYYRRAVDERDVDDLRFAFGVLTTYWYNKDTQRRLHLSDLAAFHKAFGSERFHTDRSARGTLSRGQLEEGAALLLGDWFPEAYADDARRGWGIGFETVADREAYNPERRRVLARLGELTPESAPPEEQTWHTYPPVRMPSADGGHRRVDARGDLARLRVGDRALHAAAGRWAGRADVRDRGGGGDDSGRPIFTRGYVTITTLVTPDDPEALAAYFAGWRTAWRGTARTSRARCPRAGRRWSASTSPRTRATSWATATTGCCCMSSTAWRG